MQIPPKLTELDAPRLAQPVDDTAARLTPRSLEAFPHPSLGHPSILWLGCSIDTGMPERAGATSRLRTAQRRPDVHKRLIPI